MNQVFLASAKQLRSNRQGNLYLQLELSDKTGSIATRMWNATEEIASRFENGDYVQVEGTTQVFQGALQLIAKKINKAPMDGIDENQFKRLSTADADRLAVRLTELLRTITNPHLSGLAECYLSDESFMKKFVQAPAGVKNHHAFQGGLLQHAVTLSEVVDRISALYPEIDRDLLLMGVFLHDSGKTDELSYARDLDYTNEGRLVGHIVMAVCVLEKRISEAELRNGEPFPTDLALRLKHMITSHHGSLEFGSPVVPMTVEAVALHYLDNFDAKLELFSRLINDDANIGSSWTQYHNHIGRYLYKGRKEKVDG